MLFFPEPLSGIIRPEWHILIDNLHPVTLAVIAQTMARSLFCVVPGNVTVSPTYRGWVIVPVSTTPSDRMTSRSSSGNKVHSLAATERHDDLRVDGLAVTLDLDFDLPDFGQVFCRARGGGNCRAGWLWEPVLGAGVAAGPGRIAARLHPAGDCKKQQEKDRRGEDQSSIHG